MSLHCRNRHSGRTPDDTTGAATRSEESIIDVTPGSTLHVEIGAGGAGGTPGFIGSSGQPTVITQSNVYVIHSNGGGGGGGGSATQEGVGASSGLPTPGAMISFSVANGISQLPDLNLQVFGTPDTCVIDGFIKAGGRGYPPTGAIPGTVLPPANASIGGTGGNGQFADASGDVICPSPPTAATSGSPGRAGFALISW